jgi:hypothetical protein
MIVALAALFVALGGVGVAATGGNFILGHSNSADQPTSLSSNASAATLQLTNSGSRPAARFTTSTGVAPFVVDRTTKVANLNADLLDGHDSGHFLSTRLALQAKTFGSNLPMDFPFESHGGPVLVFLSGSGWRTSIQGPGAITVGGLIDGSEVVRASVFTNETVSHKALVPEMNFVNIPGGSHQLTIQLTFGTVDANDVFKVTVIEFPH